VVRYENPDQASPAQIAAPQKLSDNARPVQPTNGRQIQEATPLMEN
jgi:carbonic anhydrase